MPIDRRQRYARQVLLAQDAISLKIRRLISAEFKAVGKAISDDYQDGAISDMGDHMRRHEVAIADILRASLVATIKKFTKFPTGYKASKSLPSPQVHYVKSDLFETQLEWDVYYLLLDDALGTAEKISRTTIQEAQLVISKGLEAGDTTSVIARDILNTVGGVTSRNRAATIARTEVHKAANQSQHSSIVKASADSGLEIEKEWIATNDGRVRDAHRHADGQKAKVDDDFKVGGESMLFPGDRRASAKNVINCRCVVGYNTTGD